MRRVSTPQDEVLKAAVVSSWHKSGYGPLSRLECSVVEGVVNLRGVVPSFFLKQMAQALVMRLQHVKHIRNHVSVG